MTWNRRSGALAAAVAAVVIGGLLHVLLQEGSARTGGESSSLPERRVKTPPAEADAAPTSAPGRAEEATLRESVNPRGSEKPASRVADSVALDHVQLECRAVDSSDAPLGSFRALLAREQEPAEEELAKSGAVLFRGLTPGRFTLHVQAVGFVNYREELEVASSPFRQVKTVRLELEERELLVKLVTPSGERLATSFPLRGQGAAFGPLRIDGARSALGHARGVNDFGIAGSTIRVAATRRALVTGDRVSPLAGDELLVDSRLHLGLSVQDSNGRPVQAAYDGFVSVRTPRPFCASLTIGGVVSTCVAIDRGVKDVTFVVDPAQLAMQLACVKLRVIDGTTNEPVKEARVGLYEFTMLPAGASRYAVTDAHGVAVLDLVPAGALLLDVSTRTTAVEPRVVETHPGEVLDLGNLVTVASVVVPLEGRVVNAAGAPVGAMVELTPEIKWRPGTVTGRTSYSTTTEGEGVFRFPRVAFGRYSVKAVPHGNILGPVAQEIVVSSDVTPTLVLIARMGYGVNIHLDEKDPVPTYVVVKDSGGQCLVQCLLGRDALRLTGNLAPGSYSIETFNAAGQGPTIPFTVGAGPVDLTVR